MEKSKSSQKKRWVILVMIILLPAIPMIMVQRLVRQSPPGASITETMGDILAAIDQIPNPVPTDIEEKLSFNFKNGQKWLIETKVSFSDLKKDEKDVGQEIAPIDTGSFRFEVMSETADGWTVAISNQEDSTKSVLNQNPLVINWSTQGVLSWLQESSSQSEEIRGQLLKQHGIFIAGPFLSPQRSRTWTRKPIHSLTLASQNALSKLKINMLEESPMPPRGGLIYMGARADNSNLAQFRILGYRRRSLVGELWRGKIETVSRGDYSGPNAALELMSGEIRLQEIFRLHLQHRTQATADFYFKVKQSASTID
jgi:hypothetical protein